MTPQVIEANRRVVDDYGRVAVQRGPLVYCLEQLDQPLGVSLYDVSLDLRQDSSPAFHEEFDKDLLGGIVVLKLDNADQVKECFKDDPFVQLGRLAVESHPWLVDTRDIHTYDKPIKMGKYSLGIVKKGPNWKPARGKLRPGSMLVSASTCFMVVSAFFFPRMTSTTPPDS